MPKAKTDSEEKKGKKRANRCKPYRWDRLGEPISSSEGYAKTNQRDKMKSDMMANVISSGKYNIMPPELHCDRCKHARWPCIYPRGVASACCHGCSHSKLKCTRFIDPTPLVLELYKEGYCNVRTPPSSPQQSVLPSPPKTQSPPLRSQPAPSSVPSSAAASAGSSPSVTPAATPAPSLPRVILRAPGYPPPPPKTSHPQSVSPIPAESKSSGSAASSAPRTPVLPRGTAEPSRCLPPLVSLSRPVSPERRVSLPPLSQPVTPERRYFTPLSVEQRITPRRRRPRTPPSPLARHLDRTPAPLPSDRPELRITTEFSTPPTTPIASEPRPGTILLKLGDGRVPFLIPHAHNAEEARLVRELGISPAHIWRSAEPCAGCCDEGTQSLFGDIYVPRRGLGVVRAPQCLRCIAEKRTCTWRLNTGDGLFITQNLGLIVLNTPGVMGSGVFVKDSDLEGWSHAAIAEALHSGEGHQFDVAWDVARPGTLSVYEQYALSSPRGDTDAPAVCTASILAEDRQLRPALAEVVKSLQRRGAYDHLLVTDILRRLPPPPEGVEAGLLRADAEWAAWSFSDGELVLYIRETPFHREGDTKELEKLFLGEEPSYVRGRDTPFVLWPPRGPISLPVESIVTRFLNVGYEDMAAAMLHAVECAVAQTELPSWAELPRIREGHRALLADDAERGVALYELFRDCLPAAETAVRYAAQAPGIIQLL